jgi:hypothetical protein
MGADALMERREPVYGAHCSRGAVRVPEWGGATTSRQLWLTASRLRSETEIRTWSRDKGYSDTTTFKISDTTPRSIIIYSPTISGQRSISKKEFLRIATHWYAYRDGEVGRDVLGKLSQNTSYIFGILKWMDDQDE